MNHHFDIKQRNKLDNPERRKSLPPEVTLRAFGLQTGDVMADIGCGIGYFTIPAAQIIGPAGKVFALDISEEMLRDVNDKAAKLAGNLTAQIETVLVAEYDLKLPTESITVGFICNVLHEIDDRGRFLREVRRLLKAGGRFLVIEWQKKESEFGPPLEHRLDERILLQELKESGFALMESHVLGRDYYTIQVVKQP